MSQKPFFDDKRYVLNIGKINTIIKKVLDFYLGNNNSQESESYLLSIINMGRFLYKIDINYIDNVPYIPKNQTFLTILSKLQNYNELYFSYSLGIKDYVKNVEKLFDNELNSLVSEIKNLEKSKKISSFVIFNINYKKDSLLEQVQAGLKSTNFIQQFKQMLYILDSALHFFHEAIVKKDHIYLIMDFILILFDQDVENLVLISDCDYFTFFDLFRDIGLKSFLSESSKYFYDKRYQFDNYFFVSNVIIAYFYYLDPDDAFTFSHYYNELNKYQIIQDIVNFKRNLTEKSHDDLYNKCIIIKKK